MSDRNVFRQRNRELTPHEMTLMDDIIDEAAELMDLLTKCETFADPRCLALARTRLEEAILWACQAASKGDIQ